MDASKYLQSFGDKHVPEHEVCELLDPTLSVILC